MTWKWERYPVPHRVRVGGPMYHMEGRIIYTTSGRRVATADTETGAALACAALNRGSPWRHHLTRSAQ